jgi:hypothetical protein
MARLLASDPEPANTIPAESAPISAATCSRARCSALAGAAAKWCALEGLPKSAAR